MDLAQWLALVSICLLGAMSPGPSLAVIVACVMRGGQRAGYAAAIAHGIAVALYGLLTVTGLALILTRHTALYTSVQLAGAVYLLYLAGRVLIPALLQNQRGSLGHSAAQLDSNAAVQGFLVAFLNPKLAIFMLALFSQFVQPHFGNAEKTLMVATVGVTDAAWYCLVTALIARPRFQQLLQRRAQAIDTVFAGILTILALSVLLSAMQAA